MNHLLFTTPQGIDQLEKELLPPWIVEQRWYAGKRRGETKFRIVRQSILGTARVLAVEAVYRGGDSETYAVPLAFGPEASLPSRVAHLPDGVLFDAVHDPGFCEAIFQLLVKGEQVGEFRGETGPDFSAIHPEAAGPAASRLLDVEQSNTSLIYHERLFVKLYRKLSVGIHPDRELTQFLSERGFSQVARFGGAIEWAGMSFALATEMVPNFGSVWSQVPQEFERCRTEPYAATRWYSRMHQLGKRTGEMHLILAGESIDSDFVPEPFSQIDAQNLTTSLTSHTETMVTLLQENLGLLSDSARQLALQVIRQSTMQVPKPNPTGSIKIRTHGDYHLGQVLDTGTDFVIIDFEGEPSRSMEERRAKHPPIRDLAGMLRSLHYAGHFARRKLPDATEEEAEAWSTQSQKSFLAGWREAVAHSSLVSGPQDDLLRFYLKEKAIYEVIYELNNRPDWVILPLRGILQLV